MQIVTNDDCVVLLGHIKYLHSTAHLLGDDKAVKHYYEEARSCSSELASELLRLNPGIQPRE